MGLVDPCLYLQADAHPARSFRMALTQMWDEGVMSLIDLKVSERNAGAGGPNFTLDVAPGVAVVQGDTTPGNIPQTSLQGNYMVTSDAVVNDATTTVSSAPSAGNTRYDIVILEVKDNAEDAGGINAPRFRIVPGTPATSGAVPPAVPNTALLLATIGPIVNGTTTITNSLITAANILAGRRATPGTIEHLMGTVVPNGWLLCDGTAISRTTYARLFAHIGTSAGAGNGSTTFNVPDLRGKVAVPVKAGQAEVDTVGETGGDYNLQSHTHSFSATTSSDGAHQHTYSQTTGGTLVRNDLSNVSVVPISSFTTQNTSSAGGHTHTVSGTSGSTGTGAGQNMPPYQVVGAAIIRT